LPFFFISAIIIIIYALPLGIKNFDRHKPFGQRMGATPAAPGIAIAVPLSAWLAGAPLIGAAGMLIAGALFFALWRFWPQETEGKEASGPWPQEYLQ
jgi:hypothetical protein